MDFSGQIFSANFANTNKINTAIPNTNKPTKPDNSSPNLSYNAKNQGLHMSDDGILKPKNVLGKKRVEAPAPEQQAASISNVTASKLNELDLDTELLDQYKNAKLVLTDIIHDDSIAANQKAQVMNTVTSILQAIIKLQQELHNVERLKLIEATLIETLQGHETLKEEFLKDYEKALGKLK